MAREAPEPRFGLEPVYYFFRPVAAPNNGYPVCGHYYVYYPWHLTGHCACTCTGLPGRVIEPDAMTS